MEPAKYLTYAVLLVAIGASLWWRAWHGNVPPMHWVPVLLLVLLVALNVIVRGKGGFTDIIFIVIAIALVGALSYPEPFQLPGYDLYFEKSNAELLVDTGRWNPTLGWGFAQNYYGYYPSIHLILATWSLVTGVSVLLLIKYAAPLAISATLFAAVILLVKRVFLTKETTVAGLVYVSSVGFMAVFPSRRAIALILAILVIALLFSDSTSISHRRSKFIAMTVMITTLAFSDHFITPIALGSIMLVSAMLFVAKRERPQGTMLLLLLGPVTYLAWLAFVAMHVFGLDIMNIRSFLVRIITLEITQADPTSLSGYSGLDRGLVLASWGVLALLGLSGLLLIRRNRPTPRYRLWSGLGLILFGFSAILALHPFFQVFSITLVWFAVPLLLASSSFALSRLASRLSQYHVKILLVILVMILFSGSLMSAVGARVLNRSPDEFRLVEEIRGLSRVQVALGDWIDTRSSSNVTILGDKGSYVLLSGFYGLEFYQDFSWPGRSSLPRGQADLVLESDCYFTCSSTQWERVDPAVINQLGSLNRIWDGGTWRILDLRSETW